jgi:riboflavin synthase
MFSGIVEAVGTVRSIGRLAAGKRLLVASSLPCEELGLGDSIAIDGACMTVTSLETDAFAVEVSAESLSRTTLGDAVVGTRVNLERSLCVGDRIGGHIVSGHIDGTGRIAAVDAAGESFVYRFDLDAALAARTVEKGSIAVDGISLTCFNCGPSSLEVAVIRHTVEVTTLGSKTSGDGVNIETDMLGKYVEKMVDAALRERLS